MPDLPILPPVGSGLIDFVLGRGRPERADLPDVDAPTPPRIGRVRPTRAAQVARERAVEDYAVIQRHLVLDGGDALRLREHAGGDDPATAWPHGQVAAAALDRALLTGDVTEARKALEGLRRFERDSGGSFNPTEGSGEQARFYDDNAWIGLDYVQGFRLTGDQSYVDDARRVFDFLQEGRHRDGGIYWKEGEERMSRNAASNGPALQLALHLHELTGERRYMDAAREIESAMTRELRREDGLLIDNVGDDGSREGTIWSYNQGTAIGADVQLYESTGDRRWLDRARSTAQRSLDELTLDRLWSQPPAFNAVFFRNLLQLDRVAPDPRIRAALESYLEQARTRARNADGMYDSGDIARYDGDKHEGMSTIDQAAFVQMHALLAMTPAQLETVS